jgi:RNA polymerase sigma-70 factor, ECF subfamily
MLQKESIHNPDPQEIEWIHETLAGRVRSFDTIILKYQDQVYNLIVKTIGNPADAEDLSQNVFFNAFSNLRKFRQKSSLKTWLFSIAINQIRNYWRSKKHAFVYTESDILPSAEGDRIDLNEYVNSDPDQEVKSEETKRTVDRLISYLPPVQKEIFVLFYIFGYSCEEISKVLDASPANIKIQLFRGRKLLFEKFRHFLK